MSLIIARIAISNITNITTPLAGNVTDTTDNGNFSTLAPFLVIILIIGVGVVYTAGNAIYMSNQPKDDVNEIPSDVRFNHTREDSFLNIPQEVGDIPLQILN